MDKQPHTDSSLVELVLQVRGLCCPTEAGMIEAALRKLKGVSAPVFDFLNKRMTVEFDTELTSAQEIVAAVRRIGLDPGEYSLGNAALSSATTNTSTNPSARVRENTNGKNSFCTNLQETKNSSTSGCGSGGGVANSTTCAPNDNTTILRRLFPSLIGQGKSVSTWGGLVFLLTAFAIHWYEHGFIDSLTSGFGSEEHSYPPLSVPFYIIAIVFSYWYIAPKSLNSLRLMRLDMNLLMTVAVIGASILGDWFEAATVAWLFAVSLLLESWSIGRARHAIEKLMDLTPEKARYICPDSGDILEKPVVEVPLNSTVLVLPGERIPLDGTISNGTTSVNEAPITGESTPATKSAGDNVFAGTINNESAFEFTATKRADETTLARIIKLVEQAHTRRAPAEKWVEKFARYYTPSVFAFAATLAVIPPLFTGDFAEWIYRALVILVIACPCALVISTPVAIVAGLAAAARNGVLVKGGVYLELPSRIQIVAFDKTGTITKGRPEVTEIIPLNDHNDDDLLLRVAAIELKNLHPFAKAIIERANADEVEIPDAENVTVVPGRGATGTINGREYFAGSHRMMHERGFETPEYCDRLNELESRGLSVIAVGSENHVCGVIGISDSIRDGAKAAIEDIHAAGIKKTVMLTGDNERAARLIASACGIDDTRAGLLPEDKLRIVEELSKEGAVAMIGDGVNDAPAMAAATIGIAMGAAGTDAAIETADIALMSDDLSKLAWLIRHSRRTLSIIKANIAFALGLKFVFVALALMGAATLWMAILADMGASLLVIGNGLRLLKVKQS